MVRDTRGSVAIIFAIVLPVLVGLIGLTLDVGVGYASAQQTQEILDRIAMTSGREYLTNGRNELKAETVGRALWEVDKPKGVGTAITFTSAPAGDGTWNFRWEATLVVPLRFLSILPGIAPVWEMQRAATVNLMR